MTDKQLEQKASDLMNHLFSFFDFSEVKKYLNEDDTLTESGEYLLSFIKKWLKDNVIEVEWEAERSRIWTPWTK